MRRHLLLGLLFAAAACSSSVAVHHTAAPPTKPTGTRPTSAGSTTATLTHFAPNPALVVRRITSRTGAAPSGVAIGDGAVWVAEHRAGDILRIDPATGQVVARIALPNASGAIEDAPLVVPGHVVQCLYQASNILYRISTRTNHIDGKLAVPCDAQVSGPLGVWVYGGGVLSRVDPDHLRVVRRLTLPVGPSDANVATTFTEGGGSLFAHFDSGLVVRIDPASGRIIARWNLSPGGSGIVAAAQRVFVVGTVQDVLDVIDLGSDRVVAHISVPGGDEGDPIITVGAGALWLSTLDGGLARMDPATLTITASAQLDTQDFVGTVGIGFGRVWFPTYGEDSVLELMPLG